MTNDEKKDQLFYMIQLLVEFLETWNCHSEDHQQQLKKRIKTIKARKKSIKLLTNQPINLTQFDRRGRKM